MAGGHLLPQISNYETGDIVVPHGDGLQSHTALEPYTAAIEASLDVCETSLAIEVVLVLIAILNSNTKRAALLAAMGLWCFPIEVWLSFQGPTVEPTRGVLSRPFQLIIAGATIIIICGLTALFGYIPPVSSRSQCATTKWPMLGTSYMSETAELSLEFMWLADFPGCPNSCCFRYTWLVF